MKKCKIALVSDWYYPRVGGIEYAINALARNLQDLGHEVHVITGRPDGYVPSREEDELTVRRLEGLSYSGALVSPVAFYRLWHILQEEGYDVVHAHGLDSPMALMSLVFSRLTGTPALITNHSFIGRAPLRPFLLTGARMFLRATKAVIAVSRLVGEESGLMTEAPVHRIPNGVDTYSPNGANQFLNLAPQGKTLVVTVSRMTEKKEVDRMIRIAPALLERHPNLFFVMVGDGPLKEPLEKAAQSRGLNGSFLFTGGVSRETVLHILTQAQIFVLPCTREAFGIAILEAFLMKVPVIAMKQSGAAEVVIHEETGLLAETDEDLISQVNKLITNPSLASSLSAAAYEEVNRYQWSTIARQVEDVYASIINENRRPHR
jgi:glycosyltransferase involved in cell wall biosynthesis